MRTIKRRWNWLRLGLRRSYLREIGRHLQGCDWVLDLGCGGQPYLSEPGQGRRFIGLESWYASCLTARSAPRYQAVIQAQLPLIPARSKSVDAVVFLQVIEHLPKDQGYQLIQEAERVARRRVILTTPKGFVQQEPYHGNPYQHHLSGWSIQDFTDLGYDVNGLEGPKIFRKASSAEMRWPAKLFDLGVSFGWFEGFLRDHPQHAFQLLAVKELVG